MIIVARLVRTALGPALVAALATAAVNIPEAGPADPVARTVTSRTVIGGLSSPAAFAVASDGTVYYAELMTGIIKRWHAGSANTVLTVPGGRQALGLAFSPHFSSDHLIYLYGARRVGTQLRLQLTRFTASGTGFTVLRDFGLRPQEHSGGPLRFGPDGRLYLSMGDQDEPSNAQNPGSDAGKLLRMTKSAAPVAGTRVYASGLRNSFGFAFDPQTKRLWASDNGPECNDEINMVTRGSNYGWGPTAFCSNPPTISSTNRDGPMPQLPAHASATPIAPTGLAFCSACGLGQAVEGTLLYGTYNTSQIRMETLRHNRTTVATDTLLYANDAPVLSLVRGPDGTIWFADTGSIKELRLG